MKDNLTQLKTYQESVEKALDYWLPSSSIQPQTLHEAMRYSVLGEGKRIRPVIVYATGMAFGAKMEELNGPACAVEMIHAYSLIHDDLPSMDNDDLRRGKPTCHKAYDEATAILSGDALQALAFHIIAHDKNIKVSSKQRLEMIDELAIASGSRGMAGGQAIDLFSVGKKLNIAELENMHIHKTGALILSCAKLGALSVENPDKKLLKCILKYAECIGLAFQIKDDILDVECDTETLGKPQGSDITMNKPTYPNLLGLKGAKQALEELYIEAIDNLVIFEEKARLLHDMAEYIIKRNK